MPALRRMRSQAPAGGAGLMRYFDVDQGGPKLSPKLVIGVVVAVIILEIISKIALS